MSATWVEAVVIVTPRSVGVLQGATATSGIVTVTVTFSSPVPGPGTGRLALTGMPAGVDTLPLPVTYNYGQRATSAITTFRFLVSGSVPAGDYPIRVTDASFQAGAATVILQVVRRPVDPPVVQSVVPASIAAGTPSQRLRLIGSNFVPGASVTSSSADVTVVTSRVISPALAEAVVAVAPDAAPGPRRLDLVSPDQTTARGGARLIVLPAGSLAGSLAVTTLAIVFPPPGTFMTIDDRVFPKAVLATVGTGTIVGRWLLDGVPFEQFAVRSRGGRPVQVAARVPVPPVLAGEHRLELAVEAPHRLTSRPVTLIGAPESSSRLRLLAPADGTVVRSATAFRWTLVPGATGYLLTIEREQRTPLGYRLSLSEWTPGPETWRAIGPGRFRWSVRAVFAGDVLGEATAARALTVVAGVAGVPGEWDAVGTDVGNDGGDPRAAGRGPSRESLGTREIPDLPAERGQDAPPAQAAAVEASPASSDRGDWLVSTQGTATGTALPDATPSSARPADSIRLQLSGQADLARRHAFTKGSGDVALRVGLDESEQIVRENRNLLVRAGLQRNGLGPLAIAGFGAPDFADQAEILTTGPPRPGLQGKLESPVVSVSGYLSLGSPSDGLNPGFGQDQKVKGAALQLARDPARSHLRAIRLEIEDGGGTSSVAGRTSINGLLGRLTIGDGLNLLAEVARSEFTPEAGSSMPAVAGDAFHLGLSGLVGELDYALNLRRTDQDLVNPASPGLTMGSVRNRLGGDVSLTRALGGEGRSISISVGHAQGRLVPAEDAPMVREESGDVTLTLPSGPRVTLIVGGNLVLRRADPYAALEIPRIDQLDWGGLVTITETLSSVSLSQEATYQRSEDKLNPVSDTTILSATFSATASVGTSFSLAASATGTRTQGDPVLGKSDMIQITAQPTIRIPWVWLTLQPLAAYSKTENVVLLEESVSEQYRGLVTFGPPWRNSLVSLQFSMDWSRTRADGASGAPFLRTYGGAVALRWGAGHGALAPSAPTTAPADRNPSPARNPPSSVPAWGSSTEPLRVVYSP